MARTMKKATAAKTDGMSLEARFHKNRRDQQSAGVDWTRVDQQSLVAAIMATLSADASVLFAPSMGGKGVLVKVYENGEAASEYLMFAEDLNQHLELIIDTFQSSAEDIRAMFPRPAVEVRPK